MPQNKSLHGKKPKVAQIITRMVPGGASRIVRQIIDGLSHEFQFDLITGVEDLPSDFPKDLKDSVEIIKIPSMRRDISPPSDFKALYTLIRELHNRDYDLIHTHTSKAGFLGRLAGYLTGVPTIIHSTHGLIYDSADKIPGVPSSTIGQKVLAFLEHLIKPTHDLVTTLTNAEKRQLIRLDISDPEETQVVFNGVNIENHQSNMTERTRIRRKFNIASNDLLIVSVGRLTREKGHDLLIKSVAELVNQNYELKLLIAGEGPLRSDYEGMAEEKFDNNRVHLTGHVEDVQKIYSAADIYVQPSLYEGFGLSVLEAMSHALPVLATRVGGIPELINNKKDGLIVKPDDVDSLSHAIKKLIDNEHWRNKLASNAREKSRNFSLENMINSYHSIYLKELADTYD